MTNTKWKLTGDKLVKEPEMGPPPYNEHDYEKNTGSGRNLSEFWGKRQQEYREHIASLPTLPATALVGKFPEGAIIEKDVDFVEGYEMNFANNYWFTIGKNEYDIAPKNNRRIVAVPAKEQGGEETTEDILKRVLDYFNQDTTNVPELLYKHVFNTVVLGQAEPKPPCLKLNPELYKGDECLRCYKPISECPEPQPLEQPTPQPEEKTDLDKLLDGECPYCGKGLTAGASYNMYCTNDNCNSDFALEATTKQKLLDKLQPEQVKEAPPTPNKSKPFTVANVRELLQKYYDENEISDSVSFSRMVEIMNEMVEQWQQVKEAPMQGEGKQLRDISIEDGLMLGKIWYSDYEWKVMEDSDNCMVVECNDYRIFIWKFGQFDFLDFEEIYVGELNIKAHGGDSSPANPGMSFIDMVDFLRSQGYNLPNRYAASHPSPTVTEFGEWQKCPVCDGLGRSPNYSLPIPSNLDICTCCEGEKIIKRPALASPVQSDAIEFAEWADENYFRMGNSNKWCHFPGDESDFIITTAELFQQFLTTKTK